MTIRLVVTRELSDLDIQLFNAMMNIITNPKYSLKEMFRKLDAYHGITPVSTDTSIQFQRLLLDEMWEQEMENFSSVDADISDIKLLNE